ncbi:MFS transporter [Streptomyces sp. NBC_01794]|uniref:MFS transporter n=1 Tax=Streptomyces sp. NBC_01794 TaxID=2975942 RepID=UPI0030850763|nr:MFS transporter [Streptomyces sp. NBC_01794]
MTVPVEPRPDTRVLFWRFWLATTTSKTGAMLTAVALPLVALNVLHSSALQVTLLAAAGQVSWLLLGLPAGVIVQRCPLRTLQVALEIVRMAAIGSVPLAHWTGALTYSQLIVVALVSGSATVLFDIASSTFLPSVVDKEELTARNSLFSGTDAVTHTGGPSLSGVLIPLMGPVAVLALDAVSNLLSALVLRTLPQRRAGARTTEKAMVLIKEGWHFVVRHPVMRPCMIWATAVNFVSAALLALTPLYLVREADASATLVGIVIAMDGVGAFLGSLLATRLAGRFGTARAIWGAGLLGGALALLIPLTTSTGTAWYFAIGNAGFAFGVVIGSIITRTYRQTESPAELLPRVMATVRFVSWGALPAGAAVSGVLATTLGLRPALWIVCVGALAAPVTLLLTRVRGLRDLTALSAG